MIVFWTILLSVVVFAPFLAFDVYTNPVAAQERRERRDLNVMKTRSQKLHFRGPRNTHRRVY